MQYHVCHVVVVKACAAQFGIAQVESQRFHQVQDGSGYRAQTDRRTGVAGDSGGIVTQVRCGGFRFGRGFRAEHRVDYGDGIAVRVGHQFVGAVV